MLSAEWRVLRLVVIVAFAATPAVVSGQDAPAVASAQSTPAVVPAQDTTTQQSGIKAFVSDVFHDYWNFISDIDNARLAAAGIVVSGTAHFYDKDIAEDVGSNPGNGLSPGATYGN